MDQSIIVGDIGATKSSWWVSGDEPKEIVLPGFNPVAQSIDRGRDMVNALFDEIDGLNPSGIWYYGAGVIDGHYQAVIKDLLLEKFPTSKIVVRSDLEGAAVALSNDKPGTIILLGTGSHAAVFDGTKIVRQANSLGYLLGDEGGGSDIGKALLQAYFYHQAPEGIQLEIDKYVTGGRSGFLKELYSSTMPNQYLASFARIAVIHKENDWVQHLVRSRFILFLKNHLLPLDPIQPVHVLGSIGCIFADLIEKELAAHALEAGTFLKDPAYRLFTLHSKHGFEKE